VKRPTFYLLLVGLIAAPLAGLVGASGCATAIDVTGKWKGTCELDVGGYDQDFDVEFEIKSQDDGDLEGDFEGDYGGYNWEGEIEGDLRDADVDFTVELEGGYYTYEFSFEPWVKTRRSDGFQLDPGIAG